jgi:hypothetical protein
MYNIHAALVMLIRALEFILLYSIKGLSSLTSKSAVKLVFVSLILTIVIVDTSLGLT